MLAVGFAVPVPGANVPMDEFPLIALFQVNVFTQKVMKALDGFPSIKTKMLNSGAFVHESGNTIPIRHFISLKMNNEICTSHST